MQFIYYAGPYTAVTLTLREKISVEDASVLQCTPTPSCASSCKKAMCLSLMQAQAGYALSGFSSELSLSPNGGIAAAVPGPGTPGQPEQHASSVSLSNDAQPTFMVPVSLPL